MFISDKNCPRSLLSLLECKVTFQRNSLQQTKTTTGHQPFLDKTQNSKLKTQNSKLKTQNSKLKIQNLKLKTQNSNSISFRCQQIHLLYPKLFPIQSYLQKKMSWHSLCAIIGSFLLRGLRLYQFQIQRENKVHSLTILSTPNYPLGVKFSTDRMEPLGLRGLRKPVPPQFYKKNCVNFFHVYWSLLCLFYVFKYPGADPQHWLIN